LSASARNKLLVWLPTLVWLAILACFSTDVFSTEHTGSVLQKIIHALFGEISWQQFQQIHFYIRKTAHFSSYGFLSALAFFSWRTTLSAVQPWSARWAGLALLLTFFAASLDEFHQTFVPSRTGNFHDVLLDVTGALFFQFVLALWLGRRMPSATEDEL
jgi:VanZ family protein